MDFEWLCQTNAGAQALARQRVMACLLVYPDRQGATSVATTNVPRSQVCDPQKVMVSRSSHTPWWDRNVCVAVLETSSSHLRKLALIGIILGVVWKDACDKILQCHCSCMVLWDKACIKSLVTGLHYHVESVLDVVKEQILVTVQKFMGWLRKQQSSLSIPVCKLACLSDSDPLRNPSTSLKACVPTLVHKSVYWTLLH